MPPQKKTKKSEEPQKLPRRIARELALLSISQIKGNSEKLEQLELNNLTVAAIRTLSSEIRDTLETAASEIKRSNEQLLKSETHAASLHSSRAMVKDALELTQKAINSLGIAVELPEFIQLSQQHEVREYALELIETVHRRNDEIEKLLQESLQDWQLKRLSKIDSDILRIAVGEILYLETPEKVAINEAIELAKIYSDSEGHRFINGVLRRVSDRLKLNQ
jgi:transcription antitermination protein NusB